LTGGSSGRRSEDGPDWSGNCGRLASDFLLYMNVGDDGWEERNEIEETHRKRFIASYNIEPRADRVGERELDVKDGDVARVANTRRRPSLKQKKDNDTEQGGNKNERRDENECVSRWRALDDARCTAARLVR
jgi:hypothetical protein